jgi:acyl carrier protein phosphodiesterase
VNFLGHLWIAAQTETSMSGAILGDLVRGQDFTAYPESIALGIRLHRRVDTLTDRHPVILDAIQQFEPQGRRYAPVLIDLIADFCLSRAWAELHQDPLERFTQLAAAQVSADGEWFDHAGGRRPEAHTFTQLLRSYASEAGINTAITRTARRLRRPEPMIDAAHEWRRISDHLQPSIAGFARDVAMQAQAALIDWRHQA